MSKEVKLQLLQFNATPDCQSVIIPVIAKEELSAKLKDGDMFLGKFYEGDCHYYVYFARIDDSGTFLEAYKPFMLPIGNVSELAEFKTSKKDKTGDDYEPKLKVTCSAVPWYIASFHWIKSALGFHAAKLYKDEFLNGIEDYQYSNE